MVVELPDDILYLILESIAEDREDDPRVVFDTLFSCAVSSRHLATHALTTLYR